MLKKIMDCLFLGAVLMILLAGMVRTLFFPKDINTYENRYAEKVAPFSLSAYLEGKFQSSMDAALADQVQLSSYAKRLFNMTRSKYLYTVMGPLWGAAGSRYVNFDGVRMFGGYIAYTPRKLSEMTERLDGKAENYNRYFAAHPEVDFYVYFIEKDTDINFETGEKVLAREYLFDRLELPDSRMAVYEINGFDEFAARFYRTDHHWNSDGSYRGYAQLLEQLGVGDKPLSPTGEAVYIGEFSGSKALGSAAYLSESFYAYPYDFPDMEITVNGNAGTGYGWQEGFLSGRGSRPTYSGFYGGDDGEVIFSTGRQDRENLLVIGESYDNAILKLLASHFNCTYSVDLRYYNAYMGKEFQFADYLAQHDITKVLLIGNIDYFLMPEFMLEG